MKVIKYIICFLILFNMTTSTNLIYAASLPSPVTNGKAVILMDANSGRVLFERNSHQKLPPASLTKIMTALLVVEKGDLSRKVTVSKHAAETPESTVYLEPNEILTRKELLYAAMLPSANDACMALAESIAGDESSFIQLMNERASELGLKDTHFQNPHGLHAEEHYSSAYDLALLSRKALSHRVFAQVVKTKSQVIPWDSREEDRLLKNQNRLLSRYDGAVGVKTGYTSQAGNCVVGAAQRGDMLLIAVSMNSPTVYEDLQNMLDYGFEHYKMVTVGKAGEISGKVQVNDGIADSVRASLANNLSVAATDEEILHLAYSYTLKPYVSAPVGEGDILGECKLFLKGEQIGSVSMIAEEKIPVKSSFAKSLSPLPILFSSWGKSIFVIFILLLLFRRRKRLEMVLKRLILFLLRNKIPSQYKNHRY